MFEENAGNHVLRRGLANARDVERTAAVRQPCAGRLRRQRPQADGQNDNGWDQGLLFLSPAKVWAQPSCYVTQMISRSNLPNSVKVNCESPAGRLTQWLA